jgi:hypothetical protein
MLSWWDRVPKKIVVFVIGFVVQLLPVSTDLKHEIVKIAAGFLIGQGLADMGKERAKIEAAKVSITRIEESGRVTVTGPGGTPPLPPPVSKATGLPP